jgi:hypothetical protein
MAMKRWFCAVLTLVVVVAIPIAWPVAAAASAGSGVTAEYEVTVAISPEPSIRVRAVFSGGSSPLRLVVGFPMWPQHSTDLFKELRLSSPGGASLAFSTVDRRTIEVASSGAAVVAEYAMDLAECWSRGCKVTALGGVFSGSEGLLVPEGQPLAAATVRFNLPPPWTVVSAYPKTGDRFSIEPLSYPDLALETQVSGWFFGNVEFDQVKVYEDGFTVRVVGLDYFPYEHWQTYRGSSPLEEALKTADIYHATSARLKDIFGEYPFPDTLVVGPAYWQAGSTWVAQYLAGEYRYESAPHHMVHAFFWRYPARLEFGGEFSAFLGEGYPTYAEGFMTAEVTGEPLWRGMLYERKFHYLRGFHFDNMEQNSRQYVLGFLTTYLIDREMARLTAGQKGINDLMGTLWRKYAGPMPDQVSVEEVLSTLKELTGADWSAFYRDNIQDTSHLDLTELDAIKGDFRLFLDAISSYWYNGHPSAYFVNQELVAAAGDFDMGVRFQSPYSTFEPLLIRFALEARKGKDLAKAPITEQEVEAALGRVTGKDHSDFFEFYRDMGFPIDIGDLNSYLRTFSYPGGVQGADNAVKLTPHTVKLGKATQVTAEIVDPDFAKAKELVLSVLVYDPPRGLASLGQLLSGRGVRYEGEFTHQDANMGRQVTHVQFRLPTRVSGGKTYSDFTLNLPADAGVMMFHLDAKNQEPTDNSWLGGFIGTRKVSFQDTFTVLVQEAIVVFVDGKRVLFDVDPFAVGGYTFVPFRAIAEALGAEVAWDEPSQTVTLRTADRTVTLRVGQSQGVVNGVKTPLQAPAQMKNGRVFVPLRFVGEALGAEVTWDGERSAVIITRR